MHSTALVLVILDLSWADPVRPKLGLPGLGNLDMKKDGRVLEEPITDFLYCFRSQLDTGFPEFGVPSFNPLLIANRTINLEELGLALGRISVQNLNFTGINTFEVTYVNGEIGLIPPRYELNIEVTWNTLQLLTEYDISLETPDYSLWGSGILEFEAVNLRSFVNFVVVILPVIDLQTAELRVSLEEFNTFRVTGIRGDEIYSALISQVIREQGAEITELIGPLVNDVFQQIVELIFGGTEGIIDGGFLEYIVTECFVSADFKKFFSL